MARYIQRPAELRDRLKQIYPTSDRNSQKLDEMIVQWAAKREKLLEDLTIQVRWTYPQSLVLTEFWAKAIKAARVDLNYLFGESTKDLMLPPAAQLWWYQAYREENDFLAHLEILFVPKFVMDLHRHQSDLQTLITELDQKWTGLINAKGPIDTAEQEAIVAAEKILREVLSEYASHTRDVTNGLLKAKDWLVQRIDRAKARLDEAAATTIAREALKALASAVLNAEIPENFDEAVAASATGLSITLNKVQAANAAYLERVNAYSYSLARDGGVLQMFKSNREQVQAYLRNNNVELARQWRDGAIDFIRKWADARPTPALKADALFFANDIVVALNEIGRRSEDLDQAFQGKFSGMFTGPLSAVNLEAISKQVANQQHVDRLKAMGVDAKIADLSRQLPAAVDAEIQKALTPVSSPDTRIHPLLREELMLRDSKMRAALRRALDDELQSLITASITFSEAVRPDRVQAAFDKSALVSDLKR